MRKFLEKIILYLYRTRRRKMFNNYFFKVLKNSNSKLSLDNEEMCSWIKRWSVFGWTPNKNGYKAFYPYIGSDFVPNEIARCFIEPILTPEEYQPFYNDKNSLAMFMNKEWLPKTYFRSMDGKIYDGDYNTVLKDRFVDLFKGVDELVVKPAKDMGGRGVTLFCRRGNDFVDDKKNVLSLEYLQNVYKTNFLIQERLTQSSFFARFNESSVNTLRIATYRNVTSGEISVIGAVIRIGGKGSFVDNACSGGSFVGVDMNGKLSNFACDEYGVKRSVYNGIDFSKEEFIIPNWDKITLIPQHFDLTLFISS